MNVELWQYYLNYVKSSNDLVENKDEIEKAFEFALDKVGLGLKFNCFSKKKKKKKKRYKFNWNLDRLFKFFKESTNFKSI